MTILVTGATGTIGSQVLNQLAGKGADVRALVRDPEKARLPHGVSATKGDMLDVESLRAALGGVSTLFLLNAVAPDELNQALIALNLAREAGIERLVYFSVIHSDAFANVPHFASKHAAERMIEQMGMHATILRPGYFIQNDLGVKQAILEYGIYPMPIGVRGIGMADVRDIGELAAHELLRRERSATPLPLERLDVVGPELLTGPAVAAIWTQALGRPVAYGGDDGAAFEQTMKRFSPGWMAYDLRLMFERFQADGMKPADGDVARLAAILDHEPRSYRAFVAETAALWKNG